MGCQKRLYLPILEGGIQLDISGTEMNIFNKLRYKSFRCYKHTKI